MAPSRNRSVTRHTCALPSLGFARHCLLSSNCLHRLLHTLVRFLQANEQCSTVYLQPRVMVPGTSPPLAHRRSGNFWPQTLKITSVCISTVTYCYDINHFTAVTALDRVFPQKDCWVGVLEQYCQGVCKPEVVSAPTARIPRMNARNALCKRSFHECVLTPMQTRSEVGTTFWCCATLFHPPAWSSAAPT